MVLQDDDGQTSSSSYICNRFSLPIVDFLSVTDIKASRTLKLSVVWATITALTLSLVWVVDVK